MAEEERKSSPFFTLAPLPAKVKVVLREPLLKIGLSSHSLGGARNILNIDLLLCALHLSAQSKRELEKIGRREKLETACCILCWAL